MDKEIVYTERAPIPIGPYSQAVKAGGWLYVSGQIPMNSKTGQLVTGPFELQVRTVLDNLTHILENAHSNLDRVVKVTIFLTDMTLFDQFNTIYTQYFGESRPARSCVAVNRLPKDVPLEIEVIAVCD